MKGCVSNRVDQGGSGWIRVDQGGSGWIRVDQGGSGWIRVGVLLNKVNKILRNTNLILRHN